MASAAGSLFARTYAGHTGVDPYTTAVSDVYQDLFDEGIFTGKGLYDVDAFVASLDGRVPENTLLSHDLFEGLYARTALVTDVEVVDDYPSSVLAHARRQHRWVRGDWQILWWLFPFVRSHAAALERNRLPLDLALEDSRQPAPQPDRRRRRCRCSSPAGLALPGQPLVWTAIGARRVGCAVVSSALPRSSRAGAGGVASVFMRAAVDDLQADAARVRAAADVPGQPGLRDGARDHRHARASGITTPAAARVGDGRSQRPPRRAAAPGRVREGDDREPAVAARQPRRSSCSNARALAASRSRS